MCKTQWNIKVSSLFTTPTFMWYELNIYVYILCVHYVNACSVYRKLFSEIIHVFNTQKSLNQKLIKKSSRQNADADLKIDKMHNRVFSLFKK